MNVSKKTALKFVLLGFGGVCLFMSMRGAQPWSAKLTMGNGTQTLTISREHEIYYTVSLPETSGTSGSYELKPKAVTAPGWTQTFLDETVLPGRWVLAYGPHEINVMPNSIVVNKSVHRKGSTIILK